MDNFERNVILMKRMLYLVEIAKYGQIKETAKLLRMKQSNLSKIIIDFEKDFNIKFLNRHSHNVSLTSEGEKMFQHGCELNKILANIKADLSQCTQTTGEIKLWTSEGLGSSYIPACLPEFYLQYPEVSLTIISSLKDPTCLSDFDLGIVYHEPTFKDAVILSKGELKFRLYGSKSYFAGNGYPTSVQDLQQNHKLCLRMDFEDLWPQWKDFFQKSQNITLKTDSSNALLNLVKNGLGISFIPTCVAAKEDCLMSVLEKEIHIEHPFWIICPVHLKNVKKIRALAEYLKQTTEKL